jgi:ElaB/YqjD/DUF883 family membrane-anchored ribosome-binding protein
MKEDTLNASSTSTSGSNGKWQSRDATKKDLTSSRGETRSSSSTAGNSLEEIQERVMEKATNAYETLAENTSALLSRVNTRTTEFVRENPVQAALGGMFIGFLLGTLITRRRD